MSSKIMISYRVPETGFHSKGGDETAPALASRLQEAGYTVFLDVDNLEGGDTFIEVLQNAVLECDVFVDICSETYGASQFTKLEFNFALTKGKTMIPVWHSGSYPPPKLELALSSVNYVPKSGKKGSSTSEWLKAAGDELLAALAKIGMQATPNIGGLSLSSSAGQNVTWDDVRMSNEAKQLLQKHNIKPLIASKLANELGLDTVDDLSLLTSDMVAGLNLKPLEAASVNKMLKAVAEGGKEGSTKVPCRSTDPHRRELEPFDFMEVARSVYGSSAVSVFFNPGADIPAYTWKAKMANGTEQGFDLQGWINREQDRLRSFHGLDSSWELKAHAKDLQDANSWVILAVR